jgi:hypothetical protein
MVSDRANGTTPFHARLLAYHADAAFCRVWAGQGNPPMRGRGVPARQKKISNAYEIKNQMTWRVVERIDGQPWLDKPVTLQDAATQVSPFVVLN